MLTFVRNPSKTRAVAGTIARSITAAAALYCASSSAHAQACPATIAQTEGPYYRTPNPESTWMIQGSDGPRLNLKCRVTHTNCVPIPWAWIAIWHGDPSGGYDNIAPYDRYRAVYFADANGEVEFTTIIPGLYPGRTKHIHLKVHAANTQVLTTQLYFPGVAQNATDGLYNPLLEIDLSENADGSFDGSFDVVVPLSIICTPATITSNPAAASVNVGETATFSAAGAGSSPRTFRWYHDGIEVENGTRVSGALTASLTISNVAQSDAGSYTCGSYNSCGAQVSAGAVLTVEGACPADLDGNNVVDGADLAVMLTAWGACAQCASDITGDGTVGGEDLAVLLGSWGDC